MTDDLKAVIARAREMQKWRRGEGEYDKYKMGFGVKLMPYTPERFGADIDTLISVAEQTLKKRKVKK